MSVDKVAELWATGKRAPYDLYESGRVLNGISVLCEAVGAPAVPVVRRGDVISAALSERVSHQLYPPPLPAITTHVLVRDANGNPTFDPATGDAITEEVTVQPEPEVAMLSDAEPPLDPEQDFHCDMCGQLRDEAGLKRIGIGFYCDVPRTTPTDARLVSCFDRRLEQMGAAP